MAHEHHDHDHSSTPLRALLIALGITGTVFFAEGPSVILTSGGTGISPDDATVEAVSSHLAKELPGWCA